MTNLLLNPSFLTKRLCIFLQKQGKQTYLRHIFHLVIQILNFKIQFFPVFRMFIVVSFPCCVKYKFHSLGLQVYCFPVFKRYIFFFKKIEIKYRWDLELVQDNTHNTQWFIHLLVFFFYNTKNPLKVTFVFFWEIRNKLILKFFKIQRIESP